MKKISIMLCCACAAFSSFAQSEISEIKDKRIFKHPMSSDKPTGRAFTKQLLNAQAASSDQAKTTSLERVIGFTDYGLNNSNQWVIFDSASLTYSGSRTSTFDFDFISLGYYNPIWNAMTPDNELLAKSDNFNLYANTNSSSILYEQTLTYNNDDQLVEAYFIDHYTNGPDERTLVTYNTQQQPIYAEALRQNGSNWDTLYRRYFSYDTNNLLLEDSLMENINSVWSLNQKYEYGYDGNNNINYLKYSGLDDNSIYGPMWEDYYTYDGNNRMETALYYMYDTVADVMVLDSRDTFEYVPGINFFKKDTYYGWNNVDSTWEPIIYFDKHLNTQMYPDTFAAYLWNGNGWDPYYFDAYTYTNNNNVITDSLWGYTNGSVDEDPGYVGRFYYEYDLNVKNTVSVQYDVNVYPNPVTDILTVSCKDVKALRLEIVNALGQTVKTARSSSTAKVGIGDLAPGVYWLTVMDGSGTKLHQQTMVKQ